MFEVQNRNSKGAKYWYSQRAEIDMQPEYQRMGGIWTVSDQQFLLDSILNEYDLPKLYLADFTTLPSDLNEEKKRFAVIDGKQRLEAIFDFFSNKLPLSKSFTLIKEPSLSISGLLYKDLAANYPSIADIVEQFPMPVMHVVTDEAERINELFVRLNKGANLTGAEKRNAMIGPLPKMLKKISHHRFFKENIRFSINRGQDLNTVAKLFLFEYRKGLFDTKRIQLDKLVEDTKSSPRSKLEDIEQSIYHKLNLLADAFGSKDNLLKSQGMIPVYYWVINELPENQRRSFRLKIESYNSELKRLKDTDKNALSFEQQEFIRANRSTNDGWSYKLRVQKLLDYVS